LPWILIMILKITNMKKIVICFAAVLLGLTSFAQFPGMGAGGGKTQAPSIGHFYGKIVSDSLNRPVDGASVVLLQNRFDSVSKKRKDVLIKAIITKSNGEFSFEELPIFGPYKLRISAVGYKNIENALSFQLKMGAGGGAQRPSTDPSQGMANMSGMLNGIDRDLGNIKLTTDVKQLEGVVVTASKPTLKMDIDKKVYNVEKDIVNAGGTALDVMKNVPSVNVDIDGNVTLRNSAPQIYIDGRPTTLTLDQIPADAIESVEVITNPSAKYDASGGGAGILNIVLKKNRKTGYNGNVRAGVDSHGAFNGGANFNIRQNKFNFTVAGFANQNKGMTNGTTDRTSYTDTPTALHQTNHDVNDGAFIFGSVGLDYFMTNRTTISLTGIKVHGQFTPTEVLGITTDSLYNSGEVSSYSQRYTKTNRDFNADGLQLSVKHLFPKEGETLTADLNYFSGKNSNNSLYTTDYYNDGPGSSIGGASQQQVLGTGTNKFLTIQTDYVKPFNAKTKLEAGLRFNSQALSSNTNNYLFDDSTKSFLPIISAETDYTNTNNVYAAYVSFTSGIKNFGYQAGLRAESSNYTGNLANTGQNFGNTYPISLFPSLYLSQKLKGNQELQLSYTRRINRPGFFQLIPYTDYTDSLNITRGNPNLLPQFTNSFEFSYLKTLKGNNTILASVYYKLTNNLITRFLDTGTNFYTGKPDLINTFVNANSSSTIGAELTTITTVTRWWDITTNINVYNSKINTDNITDSSQPALWSWFGKLNSNFKLPYKFKLQVTGIYQSKTNLPINTNTGGMGGGPPGGGGAQSASQGYIRSFYGVDAAVSRSFLKNDAATLSVSISDIFRSRWSDQYSQSQFFVQEYDRLRDPQLVRVNFTYRFGKLDVSLFKRKNLQGSGEGMNGATQGMQQ
jgi:ferric enterobactin receptor